jgi:hypothetical protein
MHSDGVRTPKERLAWLAIQDNVLLAQSFVVALTFQGFPTDRHPSYPPSSPART